MQKRHACLKLLLQKALKTQWLFEVACKAEADCVNGVAVCVACHAEADGMDGAVAYKGLIKSDA